MINSHDNWNVRTKIYNELVKINDIECPGKLFNNTSNEKLNSVGKSIYLNDFLFNVCSENSLSDEIKGYITEKIADSCLSGSIPIFCGYFDKEDEKIFNKNRIIFYDYKSEKSIKKAIDKINFLLNNTNELIKFYKQNPFENTAGDKLNELILTINEKINTDIK